MSTEILDDTPRASHPGGLPISLEKLRVIHPELESPRAWLRCVWYHPPSYLKRSDCRAGIEHQLLYGDTRAAVVVSTSPLLVAAYTDELDCVAVLRFSDTFVQAYDLEVGSRLLTVNTYWYPADSYARDLERGPNESGYYGNFTPIIADFLTDDVETIQNHKERISESEWRRTVELGEKWLNEDLPPRDGRPLYSSYEAQPIGLETTVPAKRSRPRFSITDIFGNLLALMVFLILTTWSVLTIPVKPRLGWFGTILFGLMSVVAIADIVKLCGAEEPPADLKLSQRFRVSLVRVGTGIVTLFMGLGEALFTEWMNGSAIAVWFATFVITLAFYPLRGEQEKEGSDFRLWTVYCALLGVAAVVLSYLADWLKTILTA